MVSDDVVRKHLIAGTKSTAPFKNFPGFAIAQPRLLVVSNDRDRP